MKRKGAMQIFFALRFLFACEWRDICNINLFVLSLFFFRIFFFHLLCSLFEGGAMLHFSPSSEKEIFRAMPMAILFFLFFLSSSFIASFHLSYLLGAEGTYCFAL